MDVTLASATHPTYRSQQSTQTWRAGRRLPGARLDRGAACWVLTSSGEPPRAPVYPQLGGSEGGREPIFTKGGRGLAASQGSRSLFIPLRVLRLWSWMLQ